MYKLKNWIGTQCVTKAERENIPPGIKREKKNGRMEATYRLGELHDLFSWERGKVYEKVNIFISQLFDHFNLGFLKTESMSKHLQRVTKKKSKEDDLL